jgi:hypothetical protein
MEVDHELLMQTEALIKAYDRIIVELQKRRDEEVRKEVEMLKNAAQ